MRDWLDDEQKELKKQQTCSINGFKLRTRPSNLSAEDKERKLNVAHQTVEVLANSLCAKGLLQNMLAAQLLGVHELQQKLLPYASRAIHYPEHGQYYINAITKLSNVFIQQVNALQKP